MSAAALSERSGSAVRRARKDFSITSGTLFAHSKMSLRTYLAATAIFVNEVKGKSALAPSHNLDCQYKTAFVLAHKLREAMANELKGMRVGGESATVEVDGAFFGGYIKLANHKENRKDLRLAKNQNGKRQVVVMVKERGGRTVGRFPPFSRRKSIASASSPSGLTRPPS
jgi:hypothetical protein